MSAFADTAPIDPADPKTPVTVAADALPTAQIDGVAWSQVVIGNMVYVGGKFTTARPAGSAAGVNTTTRSNLLAYDIRTGVLNTSWAPAANGEVLTLSASPDGSRVYVGGSFTKIDGSIRNRIAALDATTGALVDSFQPKSDARVRAIVATSDTVYFGGLTTSVNGVARNRSAAVRASDGALLSWAPIAAGGSVQAMALSPDKSKVLIGGSFTSMNGDNTPGYGLGAVDTASGGSLPWAANAKIRNGGPSAAITSLTSDGTDVYASGYVFGSGGNLEGTARMTWSGDLTWVEDCHGDSYSTYPAEDVVYVSSHAHYCGNLPDGFDETTPWTRHFATAFSKAVTGTLIDAGPRGYANWEGTPSPSLLKWIPELTKGDVTGQGQAGWSVTGNGQYIVYGGEFPKAGKASQQGLVRYAVKSSAPNKIGPEVTGSKFNPKVTSLSKGTARISWTANWDRDNENLTYEVFRNGDLSTPVYKTTQVSSEWNRPAMGFVDEGLTPGATYRYRVFAKDALGNEARSDTVTGAVSKTDDDASDYSKAVLDDGASAYYRLGEDSGSTVFDYAGFHDATAGSGVTRGAGGAIPSTSDKASTFDGSSAGIAVSGTSQRAVDVFSTEAWIKTTTTTGGKIIGYGSAATGSSTDYDRHIYMGDDGTINLGVRSDDTEVVTSPKPYNDGEWHHVVGSMGPMGTMGMTLSVDGQKVAGQTDTTSGAVYSGYWRIGGDNLGGWPNEPASSYFDGVIDDVAIYPTVLSADDVQAHFTKGGQLPNADPTAAFDSVVTKLKVTFDASGASDSDGTIASYAWDFGDGTTSTVAKPSKTYAAAGSYPVKLTVTDDDGGTDSVTKTVTAVDDEPEPDPTDPLAVDAFGRTSTDGWGTADTGGDWTRSGSASLFTVGNGAGTMKLTKAGTGLRMTLDSIKSTSSDVTVKAALDSIAGGGNSYLSVGARAVGTNDYRAKIKVGTDGALTLYIVKVVDDDQVTIKSVKLPSSMNYAADSKLNVRMQAVGVSPTALKAKVWKQGATEPAGWTLETTDSTKVLQSPGAVSLVSYLATTGTNAPIIVSFDDLQVEASGG